MTDLTDVVQAPPLTVGTFRVGPAATIEVPIYYVTADAQLPALLDWARRQRSLGVDIETDGSVHRKKKIKGEYYHEPDGLNYRSKKIATLQLGTPRGPDPRAYVLCIRSLSTAALMPVLELLADEQIVKVGQNIRFEVSWIAHKWGVLMRNIADCQLAEQVIRAGLFELVNARDDEDDGRTSRKPYTETSMAALARRYLELEIDKGPEYRLSFWSTPAKQLTQGHLVYAAGDVVYPYYIADAQKQEIKARGLKEIVEIEFELLPILVDTELYGMGVVRSQWIELWQQAVTRAAEAERALDALFRETSDQAELFGAVTQGEVFGAVERTAAGYQRGKAKRIEAEVRPTLGSREINYNAPAQIQRAFKAYCERLHWSHEVVIDYQRFMELKRTWGQDWLRDREQWELKKAERDPDYRPRSYTTKDIPDHVLPTAKYCILLKATSDTLTLAKIRGQLPRELVETYLEYKEQMKLAGTYGMKFLNENIHPDTGRLHVYFHQCITSTGRLSSEPNLQNIPRLKEYRACFVPQPGHKFIILDYSQIEPRLSAQCSGDELYTRTFLEGKDIYCEIGSQMLGRPITKKEHPVERQGSKAIGLGTAYNMGPGKLCDKKTLELEKYIEAGKAALPTFEGTRDELKAYFQAVPGIKDYQNRCIAFAVPDPADAPRMADGTPYPTRPKIWDRYIRDGVTYVAGPCGRKRFFTPDCKTTYTEAPNAPIQGCSATITKLATVLIWRACRAEGLEIHFVNMVHDELVIECAADVAPRVRDIAKIQMEAAAARYITRVPVRADFPEGTDGICDCWLKEA
jgi:DNA polymerase I-like protein with 3'-5' exonuclease and polymerase domains